MNALTKKQVIKEFYDTTDDQLFCVYCYETLVESKEGNLYCQNEMCLNERHYNKQGVEIK